MNPYNSGYPGGPGAPGAGPGAPASSPFGAGGNVRNTPFAGGAPGGFPGAMGPPGGMAPPPMGGMQPPPMGAPPMGGPGAPPMGGPPMGPPGGGPPQMAAQSNLPPPPMKSASPAFPGTGMGAAANNEPPAAFGAAANVPRQTPGVYSSPMDNSSMPGAAMPGMPGMPGQQQQSGQDAYSAQFLKDVDTFNSPAHFVRCSVSRLPNSLSAKQRLSIPLGVVLQPLAPLPPDIEPVPSVNFGVVGTIVRCKQCRTYVNPFVQWEANGRRWNCNLCGFSQLTPDPYYASLDESGKRMDRFQRAELHKGAVEYIAPGEYMVRPPQPPVFMFVIDVSYTSVVTGLLQTVVTSIVEAIQSGKIPGGQRVQVGIITFDTSLHFYNLNSNLSQPQMLVVSDLDDLFLPLPDDILVPLAESEAAIVNLLESLPGTFGETKVNESCLGSAVRGAFMAMKHIGGKLLVFGACIPSVGELALKSTRDNPRLLGTDREVELLRPAGNDGYKELGKELTPAQISVELFLAPQAYMDLASICPLAKFTGGDVHYYPQFNITCFEKFKSELVHVLTRYMGWEAVMRIRVSRGWKITKFDGHLFIRGQDLLVVPNCHQDQTFAIQIDMEENVTPDPVLYVQSALLYTNSEGERRIRVHTWAAMTTPNFNDIIGSIDVQASAVMMSHQALDQSLKTNQTDGRNKLSSFCQQVVQAGNLCPQSDALQFLPLYIMGMLKSAAFRATNDISADLRTYIWMRLETMSVSQSAAFFNPRLMALHSSPEECRMPNDHGQIQLPEMLNLTSESMTQDGVYLLEDGESMYMWIGRAVDSNFLQAVFGMGSFDQLDVLAAESVVGTRNDPLSEKVGNIIRQVRSERPTPFLQLQIMRQGEPKEAKFFAALIEDRTVGMQSTYTEFLQRMGYRSPQATPPQQGGMPQMPPPGPAGMMGGPGGPPMNRGY